MSLFQSIFRLMSFSIKLALLFIRKLRSVIEILSPIPFRGKYYGSLWGN